MRGIDQRSRYSGKPLSWKSRMHRQRMLSTLVSSMRIPDQCLWLQALMSQLLGLQLALRLLV